jgi:hypothetical protein
MRNFSWAFFLCVWNVKERHVDVRNLHLGYKNSEKLRNFEDGSKLRNILYNECQWSEEFEPIQNKISMPTWKMTSTVTLR